MLTGEWDVVALRVLANVVDGIDILLGQLDLLEVVTDTGWRNTLGDDGVLADLGPRDNDVGRRDAHLLRDLLDRWVVDQQRLAEGVVAKGLCFVSVMLVNLWRVNEPSRQ